MDNFDVFQFIFVKIDEFGWWDLEIIWSDVGTQFTSTKFQNECQTCSVHLKLAYIEHQEMNGQVKVTWITLRTIAHSLMVHVRVSEAYIHFALMYVADHIFTVLPTKDLIKEDGKPTTRFKLATGTKPSISHVHALFCTCVLRKATEHVVTKKLSMRHQVQKGFCGIFVWITQHQKGYLIYVPQKQKIISSYNIVFGVNSSSALVYTSQIYAEDMAMLPVLSYIPYATSPREKTGNIITFTHFEEENFYLKIATIRKAVTNTMKI